jgi:hypothetical protein
MTNLESLEQAVGDSRQKGHTLFPDQALTFSNLKQEVPLLFPQLSAPDGDQAKMGLQQLAMTQNSGNKIEGKNEQNSRSDNGATQKNGETSEGSNAGSGFYSLGDEQVLNDVFTVMQLFHECGSKMRENAREVRHAEHELQMEELQKQVNDLKTAAVTAIAMGITSMVIAVGMATVGFRGATKGMSKQMSLNKAKAFEMNNAKLDTMNTKLTATKNELAVKTGEVKTLQGELKVSQARENLDVKSKQIDKIDTRMKEIEQQRLSGQGGDEVKLNTEYKSLQNQRSVAVKEQTAAFKEFQQCKTELREIAPDSPQLKKGAPGTREVSTKLEQAKIERSTLQEKVTVMEKEISVVQSQQEKLSGNAKAMKLVESQKEDSTFLEDRQAVLDNKFKKLDATNQAMMGINQSVSGLSSGISQFIQASAELHKGEAERAAQMAQDTTEWMGNIKDMIHTVQEKMAAILNSQTETQRNIVRI